MPAALDLRTTAVISPRPDSTAKIYSNNFDDAVTIDLKQLPSAPRRHWSDYPVSVLWSLAKHGIECRGFEMTLAGDVPIGAGLSSSASVEVAVAIAVLAQEKVDMPRVEIAKLCQYAENNFIGARSGIMDPLASCCGVDAHALLLDCRSLDFEPLPLPAEVMLVICNSMVKHSLSDGGEYNARRGEVEQGVTLLKQQFPKIQTLRDVTETQLRSMAAKMPEEIFRRCLHVVTENARVLEAAKALRGHNFGRFGELMLAAHASMRDNYKASCPETNTLVELAMQQPGCYGARITGAGFGGCTVNLVCAEGAEAFAENIRTEYKAATGIAADVYLSKASNGAGAL